MAASKCPSCSSTYFEMKENVPSGSRYKFLFIQCSNCGSVVGVMDYYSISDLVEGVSKKVESFRCRANGNSDHNLQILNANVQKLFSLINKRIDDLETKITKDSSN